LEKVWEDPETIIKYLYDENVAGRMKMSKGGDAIDELEDAYKTEWKRKQK
jgi:hypothetical protein